MCVANKQIDGEQCTIVWYVDDLKVSRKDEKVVKSVMNTIDMKFRGQVAKICNNHTYLKIDLTYNEDKTVNIEMIEYVKEVIQDFNAGSPVTFTSTTPARSKLFNVATLSKRLPPDKAKVFHHCVAKLIYVFKRCRLNILLTINFLCTRSTFLQAQGYRIDMFNVYQDNQITI